MWKVNGNDLFEDNTYSWHTWSAEILQAPEEVYARFEQLNLLNKRISKIRAVGLGYNLRDNYLEDDSEEDYGIDDTDCSAPGMEGLPHSCERTIPCTVEIDEPIILIFEDGDRLEIDFSEGSSIRIGTNSIPIDIKPGVNQNNFDATQFFSCCVGQPIVGFEVKNTAKLPIFTGSYGMRLAALPEYIDSVWLVLENSTKLKFEAWIDYGAVSATDENGAPLEISVCELKKQLAEYTTIPAGRRRRKLPPSKPSKRPIWIRVASAVRMFLLRFFPAKPGKQ